MLVTLHTLWMFIVDLFKPRWRLQAENLFLRHQLGIALRRAPPAPNDYLQRWPVSRRVNSSKADKDDATLVNPILDDPNALKDVAELFGQGDRSAG